MKNFIISIFILFFISSLVVANTNYSQSTDSSVETLIAKKKTKKKRKKKTRKQIRREKLEAQKKAKLEAEKKAKEEAELKLKLEAENKIKLEAQKKAQAELEAKQKLEEEEKARVLAAENAKKAQEEKLRLELELKKKAELEKKEKLEAQRKANSNLFSLAFKLNLTVPTSEVNTTYALHLEMRYHIVKNLSVGLDLGYYPMAGEGQNLDSQIGLYDYSWSINSIPLYLGVNYSLPIINNFLIEFQGGFSSVFAFSSSETFNGTNEASDVAYGYYLGIGAILRLGDMGDVIGELRYTGMYLDFDYPEFNEKLGDMGGKSILVGYRYIF